MLSNEAVLPIYPANISDTWRSQSWTKNANALIVADEATSFLHKWNEVRPRTACTPWAITVTMPGAGLLLGHEMIMLGQIFLSQRHQCHAGSVPKNKCSNVMATAEIAAQTYLHVHGILWPNMTHNIWCNDMETVLGQAMQAITTYISDYPRKKSCALLVHDYLPLHPHTHGQSTKSQCHLMTSSHSLSYATLSTADYTVRAFRHWYSNH